MTQAQRTTARAPTTRRTVTVLVCDLVDSTRLSRQVDVETYQWALDRYGTWAKRIIERHGGRIEKFIGDAVVAVFGSPVARVDDAERAGHAALALRDEIGELNGGIASRLGSPLAIRIGVEAGEVIDSPAPSGALVTGNALALASRLEQLAAPGQILVGPAVRALLEPGFTLGAQEVVTVAGWDELLDVATLECSVAEHTDRPPFVGRARELRWLQHHTRSASQGASTTISVVGEAGIGKSRLLSELIATSADLRCAVVHCHPDDANGESAFLHRLVTTLTSDTTSFGTSSVDAVTDVFRGDVDTSLLRGPMLALLGETNAAYATSDLVWATRRFLDALATEQPLLVIIDDVHHDPRVLDTMAAVAPTGRCLVVLVSRPSDATTSHDDDDPTVLTLGALSPRAVAQLTAAYCSPERREQVARRSGGNPLLAIALSDSPGPHPESGQQMAISSAFAHRYDELDATTRRVASAASVLGHRSEMALLMPLVPGIDDEAFEHSITALESAGLVERENDAIAFRHDLVRDAVYERTAKRDRLDLHEQLGNRLAHDTTVEASTAGMHLARAAGYARELGLADAVCARLERRAGEQYERAVAQAMVRADLAALEACQVELRRLVPPDASTRVRLELEAANLFNHVGRLEEARSLAARVSTEARANGDPLLVDTATLTTWHAEHTIGTADGPMGAAEAAAYTRCVESGNDWAVSVAEFAKACELTITSSRWTTVMAHVERSRAAARRGGFRTIETASTLWLLYELPWNATASDAAIARAEAVLADATLPVRVRVWGQFVHGALLAMRRHVPEGRRRMEHACDLLLELGLATESMVARQQLAWIELRSGRPEQAIAHLERCLRTPEPANEHLCLAHALLAKSYARMGDGRRALEQADAALRLRYDTDWWIGHVADARACALLALDEHQEALTEAQRAIAAMADSDELCRTGDARVTLAHVFAAQGRLTEAREHAEHAAALYRQKGDLIALDDLQTLIDALDRRDDAR